METSIVRANGVVTIPVIIRKKFRLQKGKTVAFIEENGKLMLQVIEKNYFRNLAGILGTKGKMLKSLMEDKRLER